MSYANQLHFARHYNLIQTLNNSYLKYALKCSQYRNDAINSVEKLLDFEIPAFFRHLHGEGKKAAISNLKSFSTEQCRSFIDCALAVFHVFTPYALKGSRKNGHRNVSNLTPKTRLIKAFFKRLVLVKENMGKVVMLLPSSPSNWAASAVIRVVRC